MCDDTDRTPAHIDETLRDRCHELEARVASLEQANKDLESFSYIASHDLRAPLRAIGMLVQSLFDEHAAHLPPEARNDLDTIRKRVHAMDALLQDLLSFARLGPRALQKQTVSVAELVRQALPEVRAEHEGREVKITIDDSFVCEADPILLKSVFVNLLDNAFKYTRSRACPSIEVGICNVSPEGAPVFFVKDNGIGFDMKYAHNIFDPFKRLHAASAYEGTGLGLAIAQRVVERHGGRVWAEAEAGIGATFFFTLASH